MSEAGLAASGAKPIARIAAHATFSQDPAWFTTAPVGAICHVLKKAGWDISSVDLFEVNEALAVVPLAAMHDLDIPHDRMNVNGGACSLRASYWRIWCTNRGDTDPCLTRPGFETGYCFIVVSAGGGDSDRD
ncbi:hypothetical protein P4S72_18020 [Vibrio sp. PP-XX7]